MAVNVIVYPSLDVLSVGAAEHIINVAAKAISAQGRFSIALSGGTTPERMFQMLAQPNYAGRIDWSCTYVFWGDERAVPSDHPDSNYRMAHATLLSKVPILPENVFRMRGEVDPTQAANEYEAQLRTFFGDVPRFDLILLGLGDDGHTASLFPRTPGVREASRWVMEQWVQPVMSWRLTLTPVVLNAAAQVTFLVSGEKKAQAVYSVLKGTYQPDEVPAQIIVPTSGNATWLVDESAAMLLQR